MGLAARPSWSWWVLRTTLPVHVAPAVVWVDELQRQHLRCYTTSGAVGGRQAVRGLHAARRSAQNAALAHDRAAWAECRQPPAPAHVAPGAPGGPPNKDLTCVSVRRHPGEVQGRDRITQGRDADEGFRRRRRSGPGAPPMMLLLVAHLLQVSADCEPGLALLQGFFLLYTYMKSGEKCAGAAWLLFRPALPCFH